MTMNAAVDGMLIAITVAGMRTKMRTTTITQTRTDLSERVGTPSTTRDIIEMTADETNGMTMGEIIRLTLEPTAATIIIQGKTS
jgi:hypothetical protein